MLMISASYVNVAKDKGPIFKEERSSHESFIGDRAIKCMGYRSDVHIYEV